MATVTFLLGLAGSGKTFVADRIRAQTSARFYESLLRREELDAGLPMLADLKQSLAAGQDCLVEEVAFCHQDARTRILQALSGIQGLTVVWWCFENDLESANWNCLHRTNKGDPAGHIQQNRKVHANYTYPDGVVPQPIVRIRTPASGK